MKLTDEQTAILELKLSELQFRLAKTVRLAITLEKQPLDAPTKLSFGKHIVSYEEIALNEDQSHIAAQYLEKTTTYLMAMTIKEALVKIYKNPKDNSDKNIVAAYQISRIIRNAFAHSPINPVWSIDPDCRNKKFVVDNVITLDTTGIDQKEFDWQHYGGLLALFRLSKYVRIQLFKDTDIGKKRNIPKQKKKIYQQGHLVLYEVEDIPKDAKRIY